MSECSDARAMALFGAYMRLAGVSRLEDEEGDDPALRGKRLGLVNGSAWIQLWSYYFGRKYLPGVKLVNVGNEGVQLNFMRAHREGTRCPPERNIALFARYARDLVELAGVDAILITCSTMNRSLRAVEDAVRGSGVPVVAIDAPMMEAAVRRGGKILIVATHGPTVENTRKLLAETAAAMGGSDALRFEGVTVEEAFGRLGEGDIEGHNGIVARAIREKMKETAPDSVVLAQLSMSVFKLSYPDPERTFGIPVFTSGEEGFRKIKEILTGQGKR